jgi:hypothetical protein
VIAGAIGASSVVLPAQLVLSGVLTAFVLCIGGPRSWLLWAVGVSMVSGFVRRLLAGEGGRIDNDPLVILPLLLVFLALAVCVVRQGDRRRVDWLTLVLAGIPATVLLATVAAGAMSTAALYSALSICLPWLFIASVRGGALPDVWPTVERYLPVSALLVGGYGLVQFVVLPAWDRRWMISSGLTSIGKPAPFEVRVFGMSDSPGPYAVLLGLAVVVGAHRAVTKKRRQRVVAVCWTLPLIVPLVLTGVRLALIAIALCAVVLGVNVARGTSRALPFAVLGAASLVVSAAVGAFGSSSTILNSSRLTSFDPSTDPSLQSRLNLLTTIPTALARPFGTTVGAAGADNLPIDILVRYGPVSGALVVVTLVVIAAQSWRQLRSEPGRSAPSVSLFLLVVSLGGDFMISSVGVIASVVFASVLARSFPVPTGVDVAIEDAETSCGPRRQQSGRQGMRR